MFKYNLMGKNNYTMDEAREFLRDTSKPIKYTYGLGYRNPTTHKVPISNQEAVEKFNGMCDITEYEDYVHLNEFSSNDLW